MTPVKPNEESRQRRRQQTNMQGGGVTFMIFVDSLSKSLYRHYGEPAKDDGFW